jgi:DNA-binding NarL/FixJ family response regulator
MSKRIRGWIITVGGDSCTLIDVRAGRNDKSMYPNAINILIVEDHEISRLGLRKALEEIGEVSVIGEASDGQSAVSKAVELRPDLVLMDIGLPGMDGVEATRLIKETLSTKVIMITSHEAKEDVFAGLSAGADAYCLKGISSGQLANAIRSVMEGAVWLDPGIAKKVLDQAVGKARKKQTTAEHETNPFGLSERESQVLNLVVEGLSNQEIAARLYLSQDTVKTHLRRVMDKLRVSDRTQAAVKALRHGLDGKSPGS